MRASRFLTSIRRRFAPSPGVIVAALALVFALAGVAVGAKTVDRDEVTVVTATGGPVSTTGPEDSNFTEVAIPLSIESFTQRAGESVLLNATADIQRTSATNPCDVEVVVTAGDGQGAGLHMQNLSERGDEGDATASEGLPAPASDTVQPLDAFVRVIAFEEGQGGEFGFCEESDTFLASVRVSIVTLRN
jgi:hypothetical protein